MCNCKDIIMGSFENAIPYDVNRSILGQKTIYIDKCIEKEILYLWENDIHTTGCCCGHNVCFPMINIWREEDCIKMVRMGYLVSVNRTGAYTVKPKSIEYDLTKWVSELIE